MGGWISNCLRPKDHPPPHHNAYLSNPSYPSNFPQKNHPTPAADLRYQKNCTIIGDDYRCLEQVTEALAEAGLESSNLIVGVDFTKSNEWSGKFSFNKWSLHDMVHSPNPYEQAISIIGRTLSKFDEDNLIPCFGFGDVTTHDKDVFSFYTDKQPCNGFEGALKRYRELVPHVRLSGPTSFAPIVETAIGIVDESGGQYHVLLIIADGQVTRSVDTPLGHFSPQEQETIDAIVAASNHPLSIVLVGVGDGPWDMMKEFDDGIPSRAFDNFQFVNFTEIMSRKISTANKDAEFALAALMEIPSQYKKTIDLRLLGKRRGVTQRKCLPPPFTRVVASNAVTAYQRKNPFISGDYEQPPVTTHQTPLSDQMCPQCRLKQKKLALGCGHQTCQECGNALRLCPTCQMPITVRIRLY